MKLELLITVTCRSVRVNVCILSSSYFYNRAESQAGGKIESDFAYYFGERGMNSGRVPSFFVYSRLSLIGHLYKMDTSVKRTLRVGPCLSFLPLFDSL